jgi:hypothetical protein
MAAETESKLITNATFMSIEGDVRVICDVVGTTRYVGFFNFRMFLLKSGSPGILIILGILTGRSRRIDLIEA